MWPQALQMTRDECRGILRRLELESYSQVISVFRAQGGLSDAKAKLLEELRSIFHISSERHRAEARRVANDEQLATIAEAISGPNTWQEWSREGRRPYPLLPRVAPQTALALISKNIAEEVAIENAKLPYPAETSEYIKEDQEQLALERQQRENDFVESNTLNVVTSDPFKLPKIPASTKKNLKRNINEQQQQTSISSKKRATGDSSPQKNNHHNTHKQQYPHITANSPQTNNLSNSTHERKQQHLSNAQQQHLQKQRFFHQQQQLTKQKMAKKSSAASGNSSSPNSTSKKQATPAKSGRRATQKLLMEQKQQQLSLKNLQETDKTIQSLPPGTSFSDINIQQQVTGGPVALTQQQLDLQFVSYAIPNQPPQQIFMDEQQTLVLANPMTSSTHVNALAQQTQHPLPTVHISPSTLITPLTSSTATASATASNLSSPQIAASKRDISKNLNKLQQLQQNQYQSNLSSTPNSSPSTAQHDLSPNVITSISASTSPVNVGKTLEKSLISTTPVQKYIVEERQPVGSHIPTPVGTIVNLQNSNLSSIVQVSSASNQTPQIMNLPQFSAAATKLRAVNTTLIGPGTKMSPTTVNSKKLSPIASTVGTGQVNVNAGALHELANVASTHSQVLHILDQTGTGNNPSNGTPALNPPLHTPPAVIRLQSSSQVPVPNAVTSTDLPVSCAASVATVQQSSCLLNTKILSLALAGSTNQIASNSSSPVISTGTPTTPNANTSPNANIIKNISPSVVLNTSTNNLTPVTVTGTIFSTLGAGAAVFRKPPNVVKTTPAPVACNTSKSIVYSSSTSTISSGGPHIISNVKLTPVCVTSSSSSVTPLSSTSPFKNVLPSTSGGMMRTSVKICQSPNGKVVIQPAGLVDGTKMKAISHKIFTNTSSTSVAGTTNSVGSGSGQRIAIQKVQIIPAPFGSPGGNVLQTVGGNAKSNSLTGKSNMIFMPSAANTNVRPVTLSKMGNNLLFKSSASANTQISCSSDSNVPKTNIVVLGPSTSLKETPINHKNLNANSSLITDDNTPLDILNMPIVMEPGVEMVMPSRRHTISSADTLTVLPSNIIEKNNISSTTPMAFVDQSARSSLQTRAGQQTVILAATDWEMELDQAITSAAHNNVTYTQTKSSLQSRSKRTVSTSSSAINSSVNLNSLSSSQKHKLLNNELISIELKTKGATNSTSDNSLNSIIVVDSLDDVIVEEHEDDVTTNVEHHISSNSKNNDQPKILDMQIYQQHDGIVGGHKSKISIVESQQNKRTPLKTVLKSQPYSLIQSSADAIHPQQGQIVQLTPPEEQQSLHLQVAESEIDAGFDETIVTEIDENTAIEYIEEDGAVIIPNLTTVSTAPAIASVTDVINNMETDYTKVKESTKITASNNGNKKDKRETPEATVQYKNRNSSNTITCTNHLCDENKNKTDVEESVQGPLSQQRETIANNSGT